MKHLNSNETRSVNGGRWKCNKCHHIFPTWISLWNNNHNCVTKYNLNFGYKWHF